MPIHEPSFIQTVMEATYEAMYLYHYSVMNFTAPKPNRMFDELTHFTTKFCRPLDKSQWHCPVCGRKRGKMIFWTQITPFRASAALREGVFELEIGELLPALTPVCGEHPLEPYYQMEA